MAYKTISYNLKTDKETQLLLRFLCHISKNVYNSALYVLRQQFFNKQEIYSYYDMEKYIHNQDTDLMAASITRCIEQEVYVAMTNFLGKKMPNAQLPKYLDKKDYHKLTVTDGTTLRKHNHKEYITLPLAQSLKTGNAKYSTLDDEEVLQFLINSSKIKNIKINVPKFIQDKHLVTMQIVPIFKCRYFKVTFTYEEDETDFSKEDLKGTLAIDLGINNLATCVNSNNNDCFIIDGKKLKCKNQYANKEIAYYQSLSPDNYCTKRITSIKMHRNWQIADYVYKSAKIIIKYAIDNKIKKIVIGYNKGFKSKPFTNGTYIQNKINNQNFLQIPLAKFKNRIEYLCGINGIEYIEVNEAYTSKCSFYDGEEIKEHDNYCGNRSKRGLFITKNGLTVNADVNGALNILRKSKTESEEDISRLMNSGVAAPVRIMID